MGYMNALGMAEAAVDLDVALTWHLNSNHYPPLPSSMVEPCRAAIEAARDDDWDSEVDLPEGVTYRGRPTAPVSAIVEAHHLDAFL